MNAACLNKWLLAASLILGVCSPIEAQTDAAREKMTAEEDVLDSITAKVESIDLEKRELTLKGPLGNVVTVMVDKAVNRLEKLHPGDTVAGAHDRNFHRAKRRVTPQLRIWVAFRRNRL